MLEIYGCTETGQVAARRTVDGPWWHALPGVTVEERDDGFWAGGGHITKPAPLADRLSLRDARTFLLEGRTPIWSTSLASALRSQRSTMRCWRSTA